MSSHPTTPDPYIQTYVEILLVFGEPPAAFRIHRGVNIGVLALQTWNNEVHRWLMERGVGDDAIERKDITDNYIVWLATSQIEAQT